jgi:hypothetical protein
MTAGAPQWTIPWLQYYFSPDATGIETRYHELDAQTAMCSYELVGLCCMGVVVPPFLVFPWAFLSIFSILSLLFPVEWISVKWFGIGSIGVFLLLGLLSGYGLKTIQRHYQFQYPGTTGVEIDALGIKTHCNHVQIVSVCCGLLLLVANASLVSLYLVTPPIEEQGKNKGIYSVLAVCWAVFHLFTAIACFRTAIIFRAKKTSLSRLFVPLTIPGSVVDVLPAYSE